MDEPAENDIDAFIERWQHADGTTSSGYIDLYRRGAFICEAKQTNKELHSKGWDNAMLPGCCSRPERVSPSSE
jgi:hypothetical protein